MMNIVGVLATGEYVWRTHSSHVHDDGASAHLAAALAKVIPSAARVTKTFVPFDQAIGVCECVVTSEADDIFFAKRPGRHGLTRFVRNREPVPCDTLAVIIARDWHDGARFNLITSFIGASAEPEPWDEGAFLREPTPVLQAEARKRAFDFWASHAMVAGGSQEYDPATETTSCPW